MHGDRTDDQAQGAALRAKRDRKRPRLAPIHVTRRTAVMGWVAITLSWVLLLSRAWGLQPAALPNPPVLGRTAPLLAIKPLSGDVVRVRELQGSPVVLNFWASWCGPCIEEAGVLGQAFREAQGNVSYVGADNRDTDSAYQSFA